MMKLEKFAEIGLSQEMLKALKTKGFEEPTPIQKKIIPLLLEEDRDLVGQAQTGTGKTAAFGIPILERLNASSKNVEALVLTPTRELAIQVSEEINSLKTKKRVQVVPIYGGQSIVQQLKRLKEGAHIVVGTPGRVIDHINRRTLILEHISFLILDEADEMLNMGFLEDVEKIISRTNPDRTTLLFSATMPKEISAIAKRYMKNYEKIAVEKEQLTVALTDQIYFEVSEHDKLEALCRIIDVEDDFYGLVFCRTKVDVDNITMQLQNRGYDAEALHGDLSQSQREKILRKFKKRRANILIATDVAARGIDIHDLTHVINYAVPQDPESYVHRIGRTGRAGKEGNAITFITPAEYRKLMYIKKAARTAIRKEKLPKVKDVIQIKRDRIMTEIESLSLSGIGENFTDMAGELLRHGKPDMTVAALLKYMFADELDPDNYNEIRDEHPKIEGKTRLFVARGKKDKMTKRELVNFITRKANVDGRKIDDVRVLDSFSFITAPFKEAEHILKCFKAAGRGKRALVKLATKGKGKKR